MSLKDDPKFIEMFENVLVTTRKRFPNIPKELFKQVMVEELVRTMEQTDRPVEEVTLDLFNRLRERLSGA